MKNPVQRPPALASLMVFLAALSSAPAQEKRPTAELPKAQLAQQAVDVPKIRYTEFVLPNGLRVLLHEDHSSPIVALEVWYNVGSKDDRAGKTGMAHLLEHMMFEASANLEEGELKRIVQSAGGSLNATTQTDWTRYNMLLPSNQLETGLWLEAERMANLAPRIDEKRLDLERAAVFNEYRDRILNSATQCAAEAMFEAMFPNGGVYSTPLFGYHADLRTETVDDLRNFYATYYVPNNAVLVIGGDINPADARRMVQKQFSPIPKGKPVPRDPAVNALHGETRLAVEHPSGSRQFWVAWRGVSSAASDRPAVMALASILSDRLRQVLVTERRLAQSVPASTNVNFDLRHAGVLQVVINLVPASQATEVERLVDSVVTAVRTGGVTRPELQRWVNSYRLQMLQSMQTLDTKASNLADATTNTKDPTLAFGIVEMAQHVTQAQVQAAAQKYLTGDRVVLSVVPAGKLDLISRPDLPYVNATRKGGS